MIAGLILPTLFTGMPAYAIGLGQAQLMSGIGQPLRLRIPVTSSDGDEIGCLQVRGRNDDIPAPEGMRSAVIRSGNSSFIEVTSAVTVNDPAIGVVVTAGCASSVTRDFVLFLDPPQLRPQDVVAAPPVVASAPTTDAPVRRRPVVGTMADGSRVPDAPARSTVPSSGNTKSAGAKNSTVAAPKPAGSKIAAPAAATKLSQKQLAAQLKAAQQAPAGGDRLHLSSQFDSPDLRVTSELPNADPSIPVDAERLKMLRSERAKLVAILTGADPASVPSDHELELQKKVSDLGGDVASLRQQIKTVGDRNRALEDAAMPGWLLWLLGAIALVAMAVAGWLAWMYRRLQRDSATQPWWEQTQLAPVEEEPDHFDERGPAPAPAPTPAPANSIAPAAVAQKASATVSRTTVKRVSPISIPAVPRAEDIVVSEPTDLEATLPIGVAAYQSPAPVPVKPTQPDPVLEFQPAPKTPNQPTLSRSESLDQEPLAFPAKPATSYADAKSNSGSLDERIDSAPANPGAIDFHLDLPPVTTNLGHDDIGVASTGHDDPVSLGVVDFHLPEAAPVIDFPQMGPDTILRLDDPPAPAASASNAHTNAGQASEQFRLIQFASVVEQVDELVRSNDSAKAIALLRQYVLRDETIPTLMWLLLFELYHQVNKKPVYEALGEHFSRRYHRPMVKWDLSLETIVAQTPLAGLESLDQRIRQEWGTESGLELIRALICDRDQPNDVVFNARLQRDLLQLAKVYPLDDAL